MNQYPTTTRQCQNLINMTAVVKNVLSTESVCGSRVEKQTNNMRGKGLQVIVGYIYEIVDQKYILLIVFHFV